MGDVQETEGTEEYRLAVSDSTFPGCKTEVIVMSVRTASSISHFQFDCNTTLRLFSQVIFSIAGTVLDEKVMSRAKMRGATVDIAPSFLPFRYKRYLGT